MKKMFVPTDNYTRFTQAVDAVDRRGAMEAGMMLVHGAVGRGKSFVVEHWASENNAIFLRANVDWTPKYFLVELAKALEVDTEGAKKSTTANAQQLFERVFAKVVELQCPIIIDEAEHALNNGAVVLEKIRDISDRAETMVVLIGMEQIKHKIARYKQIARRIAQVVEFQPTSAADIAHVCAKLADVTIQPSLQNEIFKLAKGRMSEVLNIIANIERVAKLNGLQTVDVTDMRGVPLSYNWELGKKAKKTTEAA